jgi:NADH-quinone oxidoreductase subunit L
MAAPLVLLCVLSLLGGLLVLPLTDVFPAREHTGASHAIEYISIGTPLLGLLLAYLLFLGRQLSVDALVRSPIGRSLREFWLGGWRIDQLYDALWVRPYSTLAHWWRNEPVDQVYNGVVALSQWAHHRLTALQTGQLRWYATTMVFGLVLLVAIMLRNAT